MLQLDLTPEEMERLVEAVTLARYLESPRTADRFREVEGKVLAAVGETFHGMDLAQYVDAIKRYHVSEQMDKACDAIFDAWLAYRKEESRPPPKKE
jgi:hypothetical protein